MEVNGQLRALAVLPPEKQPPLPTGEETGLVHAVTKKNPFPLRGIEPRRPAHSLLLHRLCHPNYFVTRDLIRIMPFFSMHLKCWFSEETEIIRFRMRSESIYFVYVTTECSKTLQAYRLLRLFRADNICLLVSGTADIISREISGRPLKFCTLTTWNRNFF
jgi:hypothetical protein